MCSSDLTLSVPLPGQPDSDFASSLGLGLRWQWQNRVEVSLDAARVLQGIAGGPSAGSGRLHAALIARF